MSAEKVVADQEQEGEEKQPPTRDCWVCLDGGPDESGERPQPTGCACRGGATTHAHVGCLAKAARETEKMWSTCPTCKQLWTGPTNLALARARHGQRHPHSVHRANGA